MSEERPVRPTEPGEVNRTENTWTPDGGGWAKEVHYVDNEGNTLNRVRSGPVRGDNPDFDQLTTSCSNGASLPRDVQERVNAELRRPFWTAPLARMIFGNNHDFGEASPLSNACRIQRDNERNR